jgi:hypothetical protein
MSEPKKIFGYEIRAPFQGEDDYFQKNKNVAGIATEDGRITLNPYSGNTAEQQAAVAKNEAIRLWMRESNIDPKFKPTKEQVQSFYGTEYAKPGNELQLRRTILARYLTGDGSAGNVTNRQKVWGAFVMKGLMEREGGKKP